MHLFCGPARAIFRHGFVRRFDGFITLFPLFLSLGVEYHEARFAFHRQHHGPVGFLKEAGKPGGLAFKGRQRMNVGRYVNQTKAPLEHLASAQPDCKF
jgi:hypothetical protein